MANIEAIQFERKDGPPIDVDIDQIEDELERFKYMFPFYTIELAVFQ